MEYVSRVAIGRMATTEALRGVQRCPKTLLLGSQRASGRMRFMVRTMKRLSSANKASWSLRRKWRIAVIFSGICFLFASPVIQAQQNNQQNTTPSTPPSSGSGITGGTAPIETTLFAYRSLASDADGISREILALTSDQTKIVIGTAADVTAFAQWRTIMQQILLLDARAKKIHDDFGDFQDYPQDGNPEPLPTLSVTEAHVTQTNSGKIQQNQTIMFILTVGNTSGITTPAVPVTVVFTLPTGWQLSGNVKGSPQGYAFGPAVGGNPQATWTCTPANDENSISCSRNDPLQAYSSYQQIRIFATVGAPPAANATAPLATVSLAGGGAPPPPILTVTLPVPSAAPAPKVKPSGKLGAEIEQLPSAATSPPSGTQSTPTTSTSTGTSPLSALTSALPVFATVLNQALAVQQTLSSSQGAMTDTPLMNMVAERLRESQTTILIPSIYTPHLLRNGTLEDTYLWRALSQLEDDRAVLWTDLATASKLLSKATYIVQNSSKYGAPDVTAALEYSGQLQSLASSAQAVAASIDSFETSLFGGQPGNSSQQQTQNQQNQTPGSPGNQNGNPSGNAGGNPSGNQTGNQPGNTANQTNNGSQNQGNGSNGNGNANPSGNSNATQNPQNGQQPSTAAGQPANTLPQILGADLLAHALWGDTSWPSAPWTVEQAAHAFASQTDKVNFLTLHSLESGGSQLTKSNFFYGTHIFFSGGAVATFGLYKVSGEVLCSGFAYDYEGNVREKRYNHALRLPQLPAILSTDFSSCKAPERKQITLRTGMTAPEAFAVRVPYRTVRVADDSYTYEFDDFNQTRIVIKDGMVIKVMKAH